MSRILEIGLVGVLVGSLLAVWPGRSTGAEIKPRADAPQPHPPEESAKSFQVPEGFRVELVASEPQLADPVAIAFDPQGRMFVCEIHGYNLDGHFDVQELNKTGVLDKVVRRIHANPQALKRATEMTYGTVKLLEDTNGDGRMDRCSVWADHLPACYGVVAARGGVIVVCAPDIVYLADRDGDGKPEVREKLFTGFGGGELWTRINNPRWGPDNWIYVAIGGNPAGTISGPALAEDVQMGSVGFRFKPDGSAIEPISGDARGFGHAVTDWGDRFLIQNSNHALYVVPLPYRYLARNPYYAAPGTIAGASNYSRVYPTSQPHPWRMERSKQAAWVKLYGSREGGAAHGYFTGVCGQMVYRAAAFPRDYHGNHFSCESCQNLVHRCLLLRDGAGYKVKRAPGEEEKEFLTSTEQWFRPVNLATGPDGALYVIDMYREIIEDYSAIPRYLQQQYGLVKGDDRGRIWRVVYEGAPKPRQPNLAKASTGELVGELSNTGAWWRQTAQRLLVERGDKGAVEPLAALVGEGKTPHARLHALYTLDGLGALEAALVEAALGNEHFGVRLHALRLAEKWLDQRPTLLQKVLAMIDDSDPNVRLQVAFTLGQSKDEKASRALVQMAVRRADERWMRPAILSSVPDSAGRLLAAIIQQGSDAGQGRSLLGPLASIVGARRQNEELGNVLTTVTEAKHEDLAALQVTCLDGLIEGLGRGKPEVLNSPAGQLALRRLLGSPSIEIQRRALQVAGLVKLHEAPEMKAAFASGSKVALDGSRAVEDRLVAVALLASAPFSELAPTAGKLLEARQPLGLQLAAVRVLSLADDPEVGSALLANWAGYTPKVQDAAIEAIFSRQNRLPKLLDAVAEGGVKLSSLDAIRRLQLIENPDPEIRRRAKSILASGAGKKDRQEVLARYQAALALPRDAGRGKKVYEDQCAKCHKLQGQGYEVGPDLSAANNRADETLVSDVLDPSNQITVGYQNYTVVTEDGRIFTGVLAAETATSVALRKEEGIEETILRKHIDEMAASSLSMMPEDLEKEVSPQDVADLIAFLRETLGPVSPLRVVLFEDERSFAETLKDGGGTATIDTRDCFSGTASLAVTPRQRSSRQIPGWDYRIVENPGPGEFRYIRFAWKTRGGRGVLVELADNGSWPRADDFRRRYYSGNNTTGWGALEISSQTPTEWIVVTRDLWKDFGQFTLTGIAPTAMGGTALFDRIELLRSLDSVGKR